MSENLEIQRTLGKIEGSLEGILNQLEMMVDRQYKSEAEFKTQLTKITENFKYESDHIYDRINKLESSRTKLWGIGMMISGFSAGIGYLTSVVRGWFIG